MTAEKRHAHKQVKQLADRLTRHGWVHLGEDSKHHTIWQWPATEETIKLPGTPKGHEWFGRTWAQAQQIMGSRTAGKFNKNAQRQRQARTRESIEAEAERIAAENRARIADKEREYQARITWAQLARRHDELRSIEQLMGCGRSPF